MRRKMDVDSLADMQACFVHVKWVSPVPIMMYAYYDFKKCLFCVSRHHSRQKNYKCSGG